MPFLEPSCARIERQKFFQRVQIAVVFGLGDFCSTAYADAIGTCN